MQLLAGPVDGKVAISSIIKRSLVVFFVEELLRAFPWTKTLLYRALLNIYRRWQKRAVIEFPYDSRIQNFGSGVVSHASYLIKRNAEQKISIVFCDGICLPDLGELFEIQTGIFIGCRKADDKIYTVRIMSSVYSQKFLLEYILDLDEKRKLDVEKQLHIQHFYDLVTKVDMYNPQRLDIGFNAIPFKSTKTFDNVFVSFANEIKERLDYFTSGKDNYEKLGIPYTFGMLFHGEPGCGKTSMIKAIANYTKRHIVNIRLQELQDVVLLKKAFNDPVMKLLNAMGDEVQNNSKASLYPFTEQKLFVPIEKRLYVIEDIDAMTNVVKSRTKSTEHKLPDHLANEHVINIIQNKSVPEAKTSVTLQDLLELFDGVLEMSGRLMIITTNQPEVIDDALLRPGRCDSIFHFKRADGETLNNIYKSFFKEELSLLARDGIVTPAEAVQTCFKHINDANKAREEIERRLLVNIS